MYSSSALVEALETRRLLSVALWQQCSTLFIIGNSADQFVTINDMFTETTDATNVRVDATGNGSLDDPEDINRTFEGIKNIVVSLRGGDDQFRYTVEMLEGVDKSIWANLGWGDDQFSFGMPMATLMTDSSMKVTVYGGFGDDTASASVNKLLNDSTLDLFYDLGFGNDTLRTNFFSGISQSAFSLIGRLGYGEDTFRSQFDYEDMDIMDSDFVIDVFGGAGNDFMEMFAGNPELSEFTHLGGQKSITLRGDGGDDSFIVNLPEADYKGLCKFRVIGGVGSDDIDFTFAALDASNPTAEIILRGGAGPDTISADVSEVIGDVIVDGGIGFDECTTAGDASFIVLRCEA